MAHLMYDEDFRIGCHHPDGQQPQPTPRRRRNIPANQPPAQNNQPNPADIENQATALETQATQLDTDSAAASQGAQPDYAHAQQLHDQAIGLRAQAQLLRTQAQQIRANPPVQPNPGQQVPPLAPNPANQQPAQNHCGGIINRDEDLVDHTLWVWLSRRIPIIAGVITGLLLLSVFGWLLLAGYNWGWWAKPCTTPCNSPQVQQTPQIPVQPQPQSPTPPVPPTPAAPTAPTATAGPNPIIITTPAAPASTAPTQTVVVETPDLKEAVRDLKDAVIALQNQPTEATTAAPTEAPREVASANPCASFSGAELRRCEIWVLRK